MRIVFHLFKTRFLLLSEVVLHPAREPLAAVVRCHQSVSSSRAAITLGVYATVWGCTSARSVAASVPVEAIGGRSAEWAQSTAKAIWTNRISGAAVVSQGSTLPQTKLELVDDPVEVLTTLYHLDNESSLEKLAVLFDILFQVLIFAADSAEDLAVSHADLDSFGADKVQVILDVHNWESNIVVIDAVFDVVINLESLSWLEYDWRSGKEFFNLAVYFFLWDVEHLPLLLKQK